MVACGRNVLTCDQIPLGLFLWKIFYELSRIYTILEALSKSVSS